MPEQNKQPASLNISTLLRNQKYIVPLYQRNYAWEPTEITQLLIDIQQSASMGRSQYYLGTLVVDTRKDGTMEIIDGQQRFSTLTLINAVLKAVTNSVKTIEHPMIDFDARPEVKAYLQLVYSDYGKAEDYDHSNLEVNRFKKAVGYIKEFFDNLSSDQKQFIEFCDFFYDNVRIVRIDVPLGTDISHYFEVMNNRGEQLEKHEILKARFISKLDANRSELKKLFAVIWDACSQMDRHVVSILDVDLRKACLDENYRLKKDFLNNQPKAILVDNAGISAPFLLKDLLKEKFLDAKTASVKQESLGKYRSILDFPNLLLQVLSLQMQEQKSVTISLDDKNLLDAFDDVDKGGTSLDPVTFIQALLDYRLVFDRYLIKREEGNDDWSWDLSRPQNSNGKDLAFVNTFSKPDFETVDDDPTNRDLIMLQSMFQVTFPANSSKTWVQTILRFAAKKEGRLSAADLKGELLKLAKDKVMDAGKWHYAGVRTPRFIFNYLDYLLWFNQDSLNLSQIGKNKFRRFRFTQNNSVEHLLPRKHREGFTDIEDLPGLSRKDMLDYFGNLCLISQGNNSRYSNYIYVVKKQYFNESKSVESLKQVLMFENENWGIEEIKRHGETMIAIVASTLKEEAVLH